MNRSDWLADVYARLRMEYCMDEESLGWDYENIVGFYGFGESSADFVSWYTQKFDLTSISGISLQPDAAVA